MEPLNPAQIEKLSNAVVTILNQIEDIRSEVTNEDISDCFKNIQVPVKLSESIALNALKNGVIKIENCNPKNFKFGTSKNRYDIEYYDDDNHRKPKLNIEVKATGTKNFQRFREHALKSNYTIWIDFIGLREPPYTLEKKCLVFKTSKVFEGKIGDGEERTKSVDVLKKKKNIDEYEIKIYDLNS